MKCQIDKIALWRNILFQGCKLSVDKDILFDGIGDDQNTAILQALFQWFYDAVFPHFSFTFDLEKLPGFQTIPDVNLLLMNEPIEGVFSKRMVGELITAKKHEIRQSS